MGILNGRIEVDSLEELAMDAKIVTFDIENLADLVWSWGIRKQNWNAIATEFDWHILCFAAKPLGKKAEIYSIDDYKGYKPMITRNKDGSVLFRLPDQRKIMEDMWRILDENDIIIGWNSTRFDIKKVQDKMLELGMGPPSPFRSLDIMVEKKKIANSNSNRLDATGEQWGLGRKLPHTGWDLWMGCAEGDPKAWAKMKRYNIQDVVLTEKTYLHLRPWIKNHPNLNAYREANNCPKCGGRNTLTRRGQYKTKTMLAGSRLRQIFFCSPRRGGCGAYPSGPFVPQERKVVIR